METRRWTNPSQPQTLYIATFLLYINAFFALVFSLFSGGGGGIDWRVLLLIIGEVAAAFGIANERKWGYYLAVAVATLALIFPVWSLVGHLTLILDPEFLLNILFPVALFALLVHPTSREYQKIWFH